jgi:hypothetical protein
MGQFLPDAMEVPPAMAAPKVAKRLHIENPGLMIIGGGLIERLISQVEAKIGELKESRLVCPESK